MATVTLALQVATTNNQTSYAAGPFTPAAGDKLYVVAQASNTDIATSPGSCTDTGQGMTWALITSFMQGAHANYIFEGSGFATATATTVTVSNAGTTATGSLIDVIRVAGASLSGYRQINANGGGSAVTTAVTLGAAANTNNPMFAVLTAQLNPPAITAPSGWSTAVETGYATPTRGIHFTKRDSGETGTTITWGNTSSVLWSAVVVEVYAAGASMAVSLGMDLSRTADLLVQKPLVATLGMDASLLAILTAPTQFLASMGIDVSRIAALSVAKPLTVALGLDVSQTSALLVPKPIAASLGMEMAITSLLFLLRPLFVNLGMDLSMVANLVPSIWDLAVALGIDLTRSAVLSVPKALDVALGMDLQQVASLGVPKPLNVGLGMSLSTSSGLLVPKALTTSLGMGLARSADLLPSVAALAVSLGTDLARNPVALSVPKPLAGSLAFNLAVTAILGAPTSLATSLGMGLSFSATEGRLHPAPLYTLASGVTFDTATGHFAKPSWYFGALPTRRFDIATPVSSGGEDFLPITSGQLTTALASLAGRTNPIIQLNDAIDYPGAFRVPPNNGLWTGRLVIRTGNLAGIPAGINGGWQTQVTASHAPFMAKIRSNSTTPPLIVEADADDVWIEGIEIEVMHDCHGVVAGGNPGGVAWTPGVDSIAKIPTRTAFVHNYIHLDPGVTATFNVRGIWNESQDSLVADNCLLGWRSTAADAGAYICVGLTNGRHDIVNNRLQGSGENIALGGGDTSLDGAEIWPKDFWIFGNMVDTPLSWKGAGWVKKCLFEMKKSERVTAVGNIWDGSWTDGQTGYAWDIKSTNQNGLGPVALSRDVTFRYNIVRNVSGLVHLVTAGDTSVPSPRMVNNPLSRVEVSDVLGYNFNSAAYESASPADPTIKCSLAPNVGAMAYDWAVLRSTISYERPPVEAVYVGGPSTFTPAVDRVTFGDNILWRGTYGFQGQGAPESSHPWTMFWSNAVLNRNLLIGTGAPAAMANYPANNWGVTLESDVGFVNAAAKDFRLIPGTIYAAGGARCASDGRDLGADLTNVFYHTSGVEAPLDPTFAATFDIGISRPSVLLNLPKPVAVALGIGLSRTSATLDTLSAGLAVSLGISLDRSSSLLTLPPALAVSLGISLSRPGATLTTSQIIAMIIARLVSGEGALYRFTPGDSDMYRLRSGEGPAFRFTTDGDIPS